MAKKLTIGMATYDDYDGVFFSLQALRLYQLEGIAEEDVEFIVIDNNPVEEKIRFPFKDGRPLIKTAFFNLVQDVNALSPIL